MSNATYGYTGRDVIVITAANRRNTALDNLERSLKRYGYAYKIVGLGRPWLGFRSKLQWYTEAIAKIDDHKLIVTVDAFDVLVGACPDELASFWSTLPNPILIGAEENCEGTAMCHPPVFVWALRGRHPVAPYVNSGIIAGPARIMKWLYEIAYMGPDSDDDQRAMGRIMDIYPSYFHLDSEQRCIGTVSIRLWHRYKVNIDAGRIEFEGACTTYPVFFHIVGIHNDLMIRYAWVGRHVLGREFRVHTWMDAFGELMSKLRRKLGVVKYILLAVIFVLLTYPYGLSVIPLGIAYTWFELTKI